MGALRNTLKLSDLQKRVEDIENEINLLETKVSTPNIINQRTVLNTELDHIAEQIKREEEFLHASSFIGTVTYSIDLQSMEIELNGRVYNYCGVPQRIYDGFKGAASKGKFFNRAIKGIFEC